MVTVDWTDKQGKFHSDEFYLCEPGLLIFASLINELRIEGIDFMVVVTR